MIERVLEPHPALLDGLVAAHDAAWEAVDPDLLDLCRLRIAMLLGAEFELADHGLDDELVRELPSWPTSPRFSATHRACLALTEQFVIDVASITDEQTAAVAADLGAEGLANLVNALLVVEQRQRLRLAWTRLLPEMAS